MSGVEAVAWVKPGDINNLGFEDGHSWPGIFRHETEEYSEPLYRKYDIDRLQRELADAAGEAAFLGKCASTLRAQLEAAEAETRKAYAAVESKAGWEWKARAEAAEAECALIADELVHVRDSWVVPTAGKPSSRRIATINEAGTMRAEDDFDNEVWARRKCATDLDKIIHRLDAARTKEETK